MAGYLLLRREREFRLLHNQYPLSIFLLLPVAKYLATASNPYAKCSQHFALSPPQKMHPQGCFLVLAVFPERSSKLYGRSSERMERLTLAAPSARWLCAPAYAFAFVVMLIRTSSRLRYSLRRYALQNPLCSIPFSFWAEIIF